MGARRDRAARWRGAVARARGARSTSTPRARARRTRSRDALGVLADLQPAFEDPWEALRAEAALPPVLDPRTRRARRSRGAPPARTRSSIAGVGRDGRLGAAARTDDPARSTGGWHSDRWTFRREALFLLPGDSPLGLRLPLASLVGGAPPPEWTDAPTSEIRGDAETAIRRAHRARPLPPPVRAARGCAPRSRSSRATAQLWVFLPPLGVVRRLLRAGRRDRSRARRDSGSTAASRATRRRRRLERAEVRGHAGPGRARGQPAAGRDRARRGRAARHRVRDRARRAGSPAERYLLDGRAAGSGGGNHITIGGPTRGARRRGSRGPSCSRASSRSPSTTRRCRTCSPGCSSARPRRRRASTRRATTRCTSSRSRCPACSRPVTIARPRGWSTRCCATCSSTSPAPRTAPRSRSTSSTIRARRSGGRAWSSCARSRCRRIRAWPRRRSCSCARWSRRSPPRRTARRSCAGAQSLHDRFLLPYFLWRDFEDVLGAPRGARSRAAGRRPSGRSSSCAARSSARSRSATRGVELRNAIEPWHVLGEEATAGRDVALRRFVDGAARGPLASGSIPSATRSPSTAFSCRCGRPPAATSASAACGSGRGRRRTRCTRTSASITRCGSPSIDTWSERAVGAAARITCGIPRAAAFDAPPLTRVEAAARRAQRFTTRDPPPWPVRARPAATHPEQPYTLDLRRFDAGTPMPRAEDWIAE